MSFFIKILVTISIASLFGCSPQSHDKKVPDTRNQNSKEATLVFSVAAFTKKCQSYHPVDMDCLIVNGDFFSESIQDFKHENGYEYVIEVEKVKMFSDEKYALMADISQFKYKLIRIIKKKLANATIDEKITSFDECASSGNPVMESDPMQCSADGEVFVDNSLIVKIMEAKTERDGYSLIIKDMSGKEYNSVISIANLGRYSTFDFNDIKVGNTLRVKGEVWNLNGVLQYTASFAEKIN